MRLLAGVVATVPGTTVMTGDDSLRSRPMDRVADPLSLMGATVVGEGDRCLPPLQVTGGALHGIDYTPPMASAQVKSAVLLAGLDAEGETVVREAVATRAHTEEMLAEAGADVTVEPIGRGRVVRLRPGPLRPRAWEVPGDPSQAAFWVVAGVVVAGSRVTVEQLHLGPERVGFLHVLIRMGADVVAPRRRGRRRLGHQRVVPADRHGRRGVRDPVPRRGADPGRGGPGGRRPDPVRRRGRAPGQGVGPPGGHRRAGARLRRLGPRGGRRPRGRRAAPPRPPAGWTPGATTAWPWPPPWPRPPARPGAHSVVQGWESVATSYPGFADTLDRLAGGAR